MTAPDLTRATWRKSSRSSASGSDCVEVAEFGAAAAVRDSKDPAGPFLLFDQGSWSSFIGGLRNGTVDAN